MREKNETKRERPILLRFFVTEKEKEKILKKAKGSQNLSAYLREIALKGKIIERPPSISLDHYLELNRIGNNLNQIARHLNSGEASIFHKGTKKEVQLALTELTELLRANTEALKELLK